MGPETIGPLILILGFSHVTHLMGPAGGNQPIFFLIIYSSSSYFLLPWYTAKLLHLNYSPHPSSPPRWCLKLYGETVIKCFMGRQGWNDWYDTDYPSNSKAYLNCLHILIENKEEPSSRILEFRTVFSQFQQCMIITVDGRFDQNLEIIWWGYI